MMKFKAIYENGVLRPSEPLPFQEGEAVEVTVAAKPVEPRSERELADRIRSASNLTEWVEATKFLPDDDGGYDILKALDANRRHAGERPLLPEHGQGT